MPIDEGATCRRAVPTSRCFCLTLERRAAGLKAFLLQPWSESPLRSDGMSACLRTPPAMARDPTGATPARWQPAPCSVCGAGADVSVVSSIRRPAMAALFFPSSVDCLPAGFISLLHRDESPPGDGGGGGGVRVGGVRLAEDGGTEGGIQCPMMSRKRTFQTLTLRLRFVLRGSLSTRRLLTMCTFHTQPSAEFTSSRASSAAVTVGLFFLHFNIKSAFVLIMWKG